MNSEEEQLEEKQQEEQQLDLNGEPKEEFEIENSHFSMETSNLIKLILELSKELGGVSNLKLLEQLLMMHKGNFDEIKLFLQQFGHIQKELYEISQDGFILNLEEFAKLRI